MTYKIAICDDNRADTQYILNRVYKWGNKKGLTLNVKTFPSAEVFLFNYTDEKDFDILLLDIEMDKMNGIQLAQAIRAEDTNAQIVFVTGYPDFIADGYDVAALHYLMKPVKEEKLWQVLDRAASNLKKTEHAIIFQYNGEQVKLLASSIKYIESTSHNICIFTKDRTYETRMNISEAEGLFGNSFIRCHRSYLVNIKYISSISKTDVILDSGEKIPLARSAYKAVNQAFIKYYTEETE